MIKESDKKKSELPEDELIEDLEDDNLEEDDEDLLEEDDCDDEEEEEEEEDLDEDFEEEVDDEVDIDEEDESDSSESSSNAPSIEPITDSVKEESVIDGLFSEKINKLISVALIDGKITNAERKVLRKKAEAEGIDADEFDMVLDAKLYELSQEQHEEQSQPQLATQKKKGKVPPPIPAEEQKKPKSNVQKCGACGAILSSFQTNCPDCGADVSINGGEVLASIKQLFYALNAIEASRRPVPKVEKNIFQKMFSFDVADDVAKRKMEYIKSFPVPTTKEDILEFLCMAVPLSKKRKISFWSTEDEENIVRMHNLFVPVWKAKCEQIIMKARFAMKNDMQTLKKIEEYASELTK